MARRYDFRISLRIAGTIDKASGRVTIILLMHRSYSVWAPASVADIYTTVSNSSNGPPAIFSRIRKTSCLPHRFLISKDNPTEHSWGGRLGQYHKNGLLDFLAAITARYGIQIIQADTREEAEERVANLAAMHFAYFFAEREGLGRCLIENDL